MNQAICLIKIFINQWLNCNLEEMKKKNTCFFCTSCYYYVKFKLFASPRVCPTANIFWSINTERWKSVAVDRKSIKIFIIYIIVYKLDICRICVFISSGYCSARSRRSDTRIRRIYYTEYSKLLTTIIRTAYESEGKTTGWQKKR